MGYFLSALFGGHSRGGKFRLNDIIFGSFRDDEIDSGMGYDTVFAGWGDDIVRLGESGLVFGGFGNDQIFGGTGSLRAYGGFGDDMIHLSDGKNHIDGGHGFDTAVILGSVSDYSFTERGRKTTIVSSEKGTDTLKSIEALRFDDFTYYTDGRNNAVLAGDDTATTLENAVLTIAAAALLSNDQEFDGDTLSVASVDATSAAGALVSFDGTQVTYTPGALFDALAEGETTTDSFTYQVSDGEGSTVSATVTVTIEGRNDAPVLAIDTAYDVAENTTVVAAALTATDAEGDTLTFSLSGADAGLFTIDATSGALDFAAAPDFETPLDADGDNTYDVTVTVNDGTASDNRDISVTVTDVAEIDARINELHYDNAGTDTGEFVEVRVGAGQDASGLGVVLYNGSNGTPYNTLSLPGAATSTTGDYDYYLIELTSNGLQNGSPDGLALVHGTDVLEFLSYEGTLTAVGGPADGMTSTDIGVAEGGTTLVGASLERAEGGDDWTEADADTRGLNNDFEPPFDGRINELHYDNAGTDIGEFVEVRVAAGTDVSGTTVELYNGSNGTVYNTLSLTGTLVSTSGGYDYYLLELPTNGLQNGSPDGLALIDDGTVVEFLSYEGTLTATDGTAAGLTSTDIDVSETSSTEVGFSLQRNEDGDDWCAPEADTRGAANLAVAVPFVGRINELHYDNDGGDVGEFVEVRVAEGTDVSGTTVELYNGSNGALYDTLSLPATPASTSGGYDYYLIELPSNGLQNGAPDGLALINNGVVVEFLSYEGSLTASGGTASGLTATDIGVQETSSTLIGHSLQRDEAGDSWADPAAETRGFANDGTSVGGGIPAPYAFDFETDFATADWQAVSVDGDTANTWYDDSFSGDGFAAVNAFGDAVAADDWLISPEIDISGLTNPVVSFANTKNFDDTGLTDPEVTLLYSTDYSGSGDPSAATWIELPYSASTGGFAETQSGEIDLSGVPAGAVHFAFRYQSSGTGSGSSSLWQIDDFSVGEATDTPPPSEVTLISTIQGSGSASFLETQVVTVEAIVVGDFQDGAAGVDGDLDGFYLQEEDTDADGDLLTSEGIFVYEGALSLMNVQAGDRVRVTGAVAEFFGETQLSTITAIEVVDSGNQLPTAATITFPVANVITNSDGAMIADLEAYEGMLVTVPQEMTVSDLFTLGRFGDMGLNAQGLVETFTQANAPDVAGFNAFIEEQVKNTLIIDDGSTIQNPSVIPFEIAGEPGRIAGEFDAEDALSAGDTAVDLTGVLRFSRGSGGSGDEIYRLNLTQDAGFVDSAPRATDAPDVAGTLTVASFNVLNFFTSLGDEGLTAGPSGLDVRGADDAEEYARQLDKLVEALTTLDADVIGLTELENEIGDQNGDGQFALGVLVDALNAAVPGANYQFVDPGVDYVGSDAIMVGMIYNADAVRIAPGTTVEILTDADLAGLGVDPGNPVFEGSGTSRVPLAASFEEIASGEVFTVTVNHLKSKGSVSPFGDNAGIGDGTGNNNEARTQAAIAIDAWLDSDPTGAGDSDVLIIGDLNAYAKEDPITLLESEGYQNMVEAFLSGDAFELSFGFPVDLDLAPQAQTFGALDHALASGSLAGQITGAAEWRINALEAGVLDYNTDFAPADQVADLYGVDPFRSSDHDPLLIGLNLGGDLLV